MPLLDQGTAEHINKFSPTYENIRLYENDLPKEEEPSRWDCNTFRGSFTESENSDKEFPRRYERTENIYSDAKVVETLDGAVEAIQGELALVVFKTPTGFLKRYVSVQRLKSSKADFVGARVRLVSRLSGDLLITNIINVSSEVLPAWEFDDKELEEFFSSIKAG